MTKTPGVNPQPLLYQEIGSSELDTKTIVKAVALGIILGVGFVIGATAVMAYHVPLIAGIAMGAGFVFISSIVLACATRKKEVCSLQPRGGSSWCPPPAYTFPEAARGQVCGLKNSGTDCFANAALQVMYHSPMRRIILDDKTPGYNALRGLFQQMEEDIKENREISSAVSSSIRGLLEGISGAAGGGQQDAFDFVHLALNDIDGLKVRIRPENYIKDLQGEAWEFGSEESMMPVVEMDAPTCQNKALSFEQKIAAGLTHKFDKEPIRDHAESPVTGYYLESRRVYRNPPPFIWIKANRFIQVKDKRKTEKFNLPVPETFNFPEDFIEDKLSPEYELTGFFVHSGGLGGGHYVSVVKVNKQWFLINDFLVSKLSQRDLDYYKTQGYGYLFERK